MITWNNVKRMQCLGLKLPLKMNSNGEYIQRVGVCGHFIIHRYSPCQRAMNLQIALNFYHDQRDNFHERVNPHDVYIALVGGKVVYREVCTEGSQTAKSGCARRDFSPSGVT